MLVYPNNRNAAPLVKMIFTTPLQTEHCSAWTTRVPRVHACHMPRKTARKPRPPRKPAEHHRPVDITSPNVLPCQDCGAHRYAFKGHFFTPHKIGCYVIMHMTPERLKQYASRKEDFFTCIRESH